MWTPVDSAGRPVPDTMSEPVVPIDQMELGCGDGAAARRSRVDVRAGRAQWMKGIKEVKFR